MITRRTLFGRLGALVAGSVAGATVFGKSREEEDLDDLNDIDGTVDYLHTGWTSIGASVFIGSSPITGVALTGAALVEWERRLEELRNPPRKLHKMEQFRRDVIAGKL